MDVVGWQPDGAVAAGVPRGQVAVFADMGDGPAVAVLDPVDGGEAESAIVGAGDDHVSDTGWFPSAKAAPRMRCEVEAMRAGTAR